MIRSHTGPKLTQGSIFSCAQAEDYEGCDVHGLVITARCDIAHDKADVFNYLPVVRFDDWLHRDFLSLLAARCEADLQQQFISLLKNNGLSEKIFRTHSPHQITDTFFPERDLTLKKPRMAALECLRRFDIVERSKNSNPQERMVLQLAAEFPKLKDRLVKDCVLQQLAGYYFLRHVEVDGPDSGFIVLMREVRHIPRDIASSVGKGLDGGYYAELCRRKSIPSTSLALGADGFSYCTGRLDSPVLEHLMQTFSLLFGRIGLPDPDAGYVARLWASQPSVQENAK